jgi:OFA family oxalate/formate antiporter-like MFS transporter
MPVAHRDLDWNEMLRTPQFWLLWTTFVLTASAGLTIIAHAPKIASVQAGLAWGFIPIVILAIFNTVGRILSGYVSDTIGRSRTMVLAFLLQAANMLAFRYYNTPELVIFGSAMAGLCYGTIFTLMPAATADFYGVRNLGVNYGLLFTAFGAAGVLGPIVAARIYDATTSYRAFYILSAALLVVGALLASVTRAPRSGDDDAQRAVDERQPALQRT